jgi:cell division septation protein DedD
MKKKLAKKTSPRSQKKYFLQLTGKGFFLTLCLLFLVSGWMFVLGVLVGRGTAPVNFDIQALQKELIALKESVLKQESRVIETAPGKTDSKATFDFYEVLKGKQQEEEIKVPPKKKKTLASSPTEPKPYKPPIKLQAPKEDKVTAPAPLIRAVKGGIMAVQVASTKDANSADEMVAKLKRMGYDAFRTVAKIAGKGTWYRVRVGPYRTRSDAQQVLRALRKDAFEGIVVRN